MRIPMSKTMTEITRFAGNGDILDGGWILYFDEEHSEYVLVHTSGRNKDPEGNRGSAPWDSYDVRRVIIPADVYEEYDWAERSNDNLSVLNGKSEDAKVRALEVVSIGDYHGWDNLDSYPISLSGKEISERWELDELDVDTREAFGEACGRVTSYDVEEEVALLYAARTTYETNERSFFEDLRDAHRLRTEAQDYIAAEQKQSDAAWFVDALLTSMNNPANNLNNHIPLDAKKIDVFVSFDTGPGVYVTIEEGRWVKKEP
jgi:hypothetical protein